MLNTDRLDLLRLFVKIAICGKISEAAEVLGISQPSASRLLKKLEAILDTRLVERSASGIRLTPIGQETLVAARRLLDQWESVVDLAKSEQRTLSGHIRIAGPIAVGQSVLSLIIAAFLRKHPGITIELNLRDDQIDLSSNECDLWIKVGSIRSDQLVVREILQAERAVVCSPELSAAIHPRELQKGRAIRLLPFVPQSILLAMGPDEQYVLDQSCVLTTNNLYAALEAVRAGIGYSVLPLWAVQVDLNRGTLVRTCPAWSPPPLALSIAYLPGRTRSARVSALIKFLQAELARVDGMGSAFLEERAARETVKMYKLVARD